MSDPSTRSRGPAPEPILRCSGLRKTFDERVAVADVGFEIAPGETYGLLGPNGAGKTTPISMICGLLARDAGDVIVAGRAVDTHAVAAKASIGYVPQEIALYPDLTAEENLRFFGSLHGIAGDELDGRVSRVLETVALTDRARDRAQEYSGGMQRRLNIALGLLNDPALLILDEPTVGVDPQSRNAILGSVARSSDEGMAILYTTHYMEEAERLCDRVGIIDEGVLRAEGTRRELVGLVGEHDRLRIDADGDLEDAADATRRVAGVASAAVAGGGLDVLMRDARGALADVIRAVDGAGGAITGVEVHEPNLEAVFLHLTGKALRDEA
ncbi:MAG TPA: ABC transporter ATP-binding protein [Actinomycetota bacterium]|nr:ABC transporter ATP-binding protein [Actinomycetota bacterium]